MLAFVGVSACTFDARTDRSTPGPGTAGAAPVGPSGAPDTRTLFTRRLERASFGVTPELLAAVDAAGGLEGWIDDQLRLASSIPRSTDGLPGDPLFAAVESRLPPVPARRFESNEERARAVQLSRQTLTGRTVLAAAYAPDQLRQRVVDVLVDLLHVSSGEQPTVFSVCDYEAVLRAGAFGRYADLLVATARHPAMLSYLDQATSRADRGRVPNENYAREVMELHTVGVTGGYDEQDVAELAHVLSGWSLDSTTSTFAFRPAWHDLGSFAAGGDILGWRPTSGQSGEAAGVAVLEHLARHDATARRVAHLFARRLVAEDIGEDHPLVAEAAAAYREHDTALGPMVRTLLVSEHFGDAATMLLRRPIDLVAHTLRTRGARPDPAGIESTVELLYGLLHVMGHVPADWPAPNGFPISSAAWANAGAMIGRWNSLITLASVEAGAVPVADLCLPAHQLY